MNEKNANQPFTHRILAAVICALVFISPPVMAVDNRAAELDQHLEEVRTRLELSDEQLEQIEPVLESGQSARQSVLSSYGVDLENGRSSSGRLGLRKARAMREELEMVQVDTLNELEPILDDEQIEEYHRILKERRAEMRQRIRSLR